MQLSAGDKLGPYEIAALIGKGGMGKVYRGTDTRLGRQYFSEVRVCMSKDLRPIPCTAERSCVRPSVVLPPVR